MRSNHFLYLAVNSRWSVAVRPLAGLPRSHHPRTDHHLRRLDRQVEGRCEIQSGCPRADYGSLRNGALKIHCCSQRIHGTGEFGQRSIAGQLDQSPAMPGESRLKSLLSMFPETRERAGLVPAHQSRVATMSAARIAAKRRCSRAKLSFEVEKTTTRYSRAGSAAKLIAARRLRSGLRVQRRCAGTYLPACDPRAERRRVSPLTGTRRMPVTASDLS
jgi:hypothetical protein